MIRKIMLLLAIALFILGYRYARCDEIRTDTFSVQAGSEWKIIKSKPNYVKVKKNYGNGQYVTIMFSSMPDANSIGRTAKEMRKETMRLVKETNARFKKFIEGANLPDLPLIKEVEMVLTDFAKVGETYFVMSSMLFVPVAAEEFPIGYITLTNQENGHRYAIIVTTRAKSVSTSESMMDESLRLIESFRTFEHGQLPV
jgi:hypothetical protein